MTIRSGWVLSLALAPLVAAQQGNLAGPVAGYVFDSAHHAVRPIQGVPGAALLGDPVGFGIRLSAAYVSPRQDSVLAVGADQSLHLFRMGASGPEEVSLGGLSGAPQSVVFSPSGTALALFSQGKARVITGLPDVPSPAGTITLQSGVALPSRTGAAARPRPVGARSATFAISDDGAYLLQVAAGSLRLLSVHGEDRNLLTAGPDALVAFAPGGHDAALMDPAGGLLLIRDAAGVAQQQPVAALDDGLASPAGVAFSLDGGKLYVASSKAHSVAAFDLAEGGRSDISCGCTPTTLTPLGNLFRLTDMTAMPLWLLDTGFTGPRTVFVPARSE